MSNANLSFPMRLVFIHPACGKAAFYLNTMPLFNGAAESRIVEKLDGSTPDFAEAVVCGACGEKVTRDEFKTSNIWERIDGWIDRRPQGYEQ